MNIWSKKAQRTTTRNVLTPMKQEKDRATRKVETDKSSEHTKVKLNVVCQREREREKMARKTHYD